MKASCCQLKYSASGRLLAGCSRKGELRVWQIAADRTAELLLHVPETEQEHLISARARPFRFVDGERLAIVTDSGIAFWKAGWSEPREEITFPDDVRESGYRFIRVSGDGTKYLFGLEETVALIDVKNDTGETFPSPP